MKLPHWSTMFREADGNVSSARVGFLLTLLNINVLMDLSFALQRPILSIPETLVYLVLALAGLKWAQFKHESDGPSSDPPHG